MDFKTISPSLYILITGNFSYVKQTIFFYSLRRKFHFQHIHSAIFQCIHSFRCLANISSEVEY